MPRRNAQSSETPISTKDLGQRIRAARVRRGLSLAQLGGDDLTRGFLSAVENGRSSISLKALALVASRLQLPISHFLDDAGDTHDRATELLLGEAESAFRSQKPTDALRLISLAGDVPHLRARRLWLEGLTLTHLGRARDAIPLLEEALTRAETEPDLRQTVRVEYTLAMALYMASNYDAAQAHLRHAHECAQNRLDDRSLLGKITVALGHVQNMQGNSGGALEQYARARQLFDSVDELDNLAAVYSGLSRAQRQNGDLISAVRYSQLSLAIFEARDNQREAAKELSNMAARYEEMGKTEEALVTARDAVNRAIQSHAPDVESLARSTLATVFLRMRQLDDVRAQAAAVQALGLDERDLGVIDMVIVLAKMAEELGNKAEADGLNARALSALHSIGSLTRYADVAVAYSDALSARGDMEGALTWALTAAKTLKSRSA